MAVKIRLTRMGRKKKPFYRIVVADERAPRDGRYIEAIGYYNPIENPPVIQINETSANLWLDQGAKPSDTVRSLLKKQGILFRRSLNKKGLDEAQIADEMKKWEALQIQKQKEIEKKTAEKKKVKAEEKPKEEVKEEKTTETKPETVKEASPEPAEAAKKEESEKVEVKAEEVKEEAQEEKPSEKAEETEPAKESAEEKSSE